MFTSFSALHLITVLSLATLIAGLCVVGRRLTGSAKRRYEVGLGVATAALWVGYQVYDTAANGFSVRHSLPLQFCDFAALIAAFEFARPTRSVHSLAWFWGVTLGSQAVFTPDLAGGPDTLAFWAFWLYHFFIVGAGVYAIAVRGFRPEWRDLRLAIGLGLLYAVFVFAIDAAFGLNYGYFGRSDPAQPTILDLLGPWPLRCLWMVLLGAAGMFVLWLPWYVVARRAR